MQKRQIDKKLTKQVRIDAEIHRELKMMAAESGETIKSLLEGCLVELLSPLNKQSKGERGT